MAASVGTSTAGTNAPKKGPLYLALAFLAGGLGVSTYLIRAKLALENDPNFKSACNFGDKLNCDAVQTSDYSTIFGLPLGVYAIPTYIVMAYLAFVALRSTATPERPMAAQSARSAAAAMVGIGLTTIGFSLYLAYISSVVLGVFCIFCISLYVVNIGSTGLAFYASGMKFGEVLSELGAIVKGIKQPALSAAVVVLIGFVGAYGMYSSMKGSMQSSYKDQIDDLFADEEFEEVVEPVEVASAQGAIERAGGTAPAGQGAAVDAPKKTVKKVKKRRPKAKKTENGLSYFEVPAEPNDWAKGPEDAPVTVVKFADFECGYCRIVHYNMKPLIKKYEGKVRWVMKHYPMNADCNYRMGGERMHPDACNAAYSSHCAGEQGKFWELHDKLYDNQKAMSKDQLRGYAESLGLDMAAYDQCLGAKTTRDKIRSDIKIAGKAYIYGTPRAYVNGRLVSGSASTSILEYYIEKSLEEAAAEQAGDVEEVVEVGANHSMVKANKASGDFYIDAYEAAMTKDGKAVSLPNVQPAEVSWYTANEACQKAGKRICTEEEWVAACTGKAPIDNNNNKFFADDAVEGRMYPYGLFYEKGNCRDAEDEYEGSAGKTGSKGECRTPAGAFDLVGNLGEWVEPDEKKAAVVGGDWRGGERAACNKRNVTFGPGQANNTLGFRCCADAPVDQGAVSEADLKKMGGDVIGSALPAFSAELQGGGTFDSKSVKGKVTYLTFFASWCGSCKRELPELNKWNDQYKDQGFQVIAVGVDKNSKQSEDFADKYSPNYPVALDPKAKVMGLFDINAMPTSYIIDRQGVVRHKEVGFKKDEVHLVKTRIEGLLRQK